VARVWVNVWTENLGASRARDERVFANVDLAVLAHASVRSNRTTTARSSRRNLEHVERVMHADGLLPDVRVYEHLGRLVQLVKSVPHV
jgi:hypothetical protein